MAAARNNNVQPQDRDSGLVARSWVSRSGRRGELTEKPLVGEHVEAAFLNRHGHLQHAAGTVRRDDSGELVVESWADGVRRETFVTRDANVDVLSRKPSR
jgi:hypothetical protein